MSAIRYNVLAILALSVTMLAACQTARTVTVSLPPQLCKPASDLGIKHLKRVPEVATGNDQFYSLFLMERADHATDIRDFNSLFRTCVDPTLPENIPVFGE